MEPFKPIASPAVSVAVANIDTDTIIPASFCAGVKKEGLGDGFLYNLRFDGDRKERRDFPLNEPRASARILLTYDNFGCGSSREHAVWACMDFGFQCVIAPSFSDIFYENSLKNGLLPVRLPRTDVEHLMEAARNGANAVITVDLESCIVSGPDGENYSFDIARHHKQNLLAGLDEIGATLASERVISDFERARERVSLQVPILS